MTPNLEEKVRNLQVARAHVSSTRLAANAAKDAFRSALNKQGEAEAVYTRALNELEQAAQQ